MQTPIQMTKLKNNHSAIYKTIAGIRFLENEYNDIIVAATNENRSLTNFIRTSAIQNSKKFIKE